MGKASLCLMQLLSCCDPFLRAWAKQRLAHYKVRTRLRILAELPRNPMGKVIKLDLAQLFTAPYG